MSTRLSEESMTDDQNIKQFMQDAYEKNSQANQTYWLEGTKDVRFKAGDQNLWNELYTNYPAFQSKKFNFNRIRKIINLVAGHQRRGRKATTILPMEGADEETAEQFTTLISWIYQNIDAYHVISEAFEGALTTGMNLLSTWMDYRTDPINGDVRLDNLSYNGYMMDQFFTKADLSDANFVWTRKYLSKEQASSLMPVRRDEIFQMTPFKQDDKFTFLPENVNIQNPFLLPYDEFWYLDYRPVKLLVDGQSGDTMEWTGEDKDLKDFLKQFPQVSITKSEKQTVKLAVVLNNQVMFNGPNPFGVDKYPFVPVFAYFEPDVPYYEWKIQGMVRPLRDAQFLYNRRKVIELDILESQVNSGMKVMEGSLVDDNDAFLSGQGRGLFIKQSAPLGMGSVEQIPPPQIPPSMIQLSELLSQELLQISGVNEELLGQADDDKAGILSMLRQGAGLTTLQTLFDNLDRSQKLLGELTLGMVQSNFTPGKVQRILGKPPSDQFFNKAFQKFDAVVAEGQMTETQMKRNFGLLFEMMQAGLPIPPETLMEFAPIPDKKKILEGMQKQQEAAQQQQQKQEEIQMAQIQSQIKLAEARAVADQGLGVERLSRVEENRALAIERRAEAIKDLDLAALDKVRAAKELQGIDLTQLQQLIDIISSLQEQDVAKAEALQQPAQPAQPQEA